ncbi:gliding motility-associated-like protein [Larkinella arboricola]|uniref:Gliding motility-associated-like protein n=1 Tax=Larkinella arboricola TaxID=643671 RepID=A0A327X8A0_LARAB|nr:gliding motility-associated C-terminal domain-containing protein [Larkinella arboricola]RAK02961.1 gliding motility-associated-like protein [Larkinella arboricola]
MKRFLLLFCCVGFCLTTASDALATHVRAGEITTRRISSTALTYEITLTVYYDVTRGAGGGYQAALSQRDVNFCFGVGQEMRRVPRVDAETRNINPNTTINIYRTTYTYPGPGTYEISCTIVNRNEGTRNIPNSIETNFKLRTTIVVNSGLGLNSTPVLLNPPLDSARVGQKWCHNPAAFDADGDSLAYRLYVPSGKQYEADDASCSPLPVAGYTNPATIGRNPTTEAGTGPATLTVNPITGDVCWDAPAEQGQYNIAFIVEEWRDGVKIGEIVRDVQIIVTPSINKRPELKVPDEICVEAGTLINEAITAIDPDGNRLELTGYGGPFNKGADGTTLNLVANPTATLTPSGIQNSPLTGTFRWQTNCAHVREEPYDVIFRVIDFPHATQTQLATLGSFRIRVYAPKPQNLTARPTADAAGRAIALSWSAYTCGTTAPPANAQMVIYRKEGCTTLTPDVCETGVPAGSGYVEVGRVPIGQTNFTDNNKGGGLARGVAYSYRIVVQYPRPGNGQSVVSEEACITLPEQVPLITHVTVDSTDAARGVITVRWTRPPGINPNDGTGPYQYRLLRATGLNGTDFTQIAAINTTLQASAADTVFTDRGLNTVANAYRYRVEFYITDPVSGQLQRLDATENASSVRLTATPGMRRVQLNWQARTPWSNDNRVHRIYRSKTGPNGPFNRIAEVTVQGPDTYTYTDTGADAYAADETVPATMSTDSNYCYRVETAGQYTPPLSATLLYNFSQGVCATPIDTTRPCPPVLSIDQIDCASLSDDALCNQPTFTNTLTWQSPSTGSCDRNVVKYNLYYTPCQDSEPQLLATIDAATLTYRHENLTSMAGCYQITAVSRSGQESAPSNRVCKDNCPFFGMPNVFTPNGDGKNDVFQPLRCPRFVESAELTIINRWGMKVYENSGEGLRWDGKTNREQDLPGGIYFYQVRVKFKRLDCSAPAEVYKGWVEMLRESGGTN